MSAKLLLIGISALALAATGCVSMTPATQPAATPIVIYVTPAPTPAVTPAPIVAITPVPLPTIAARPTFTNDDSKIDSLIRDGVTQMLSIMNETNTPGYSPSAVFTEARNFASSQEVSLMVYRPSSCTATAVSLYSQSMTDLKQGSQGFLDAMANGTLSTFDSAQFTAAGKEAGQALNSLNASCT